MTFDYPFDYPFDFSLRVSGIIFITYAKIRNIGTPDNLKIFGSSNTKGII
jgi:hypothetical protein